MTQSIAQLRASRLLPTAWVPATITIWEMPLPCGATGKVNRKRLTSTTAAALSHRAGDARQELEVDACPLPKATPFADLCTAVEEVWVALLGPAAQTAQHASFAELGGDSLLAMRGVTRLKAILAPPPPPDVDPEAEAARAVGRTSAAFAPSCLFSASSSRSYAVRLAEELDIALTEEERTWCKRSLALEEARHCQTLLEAEPTALLQAAASADAVAAIEALLNPEFPLCDVNGGWTRQSPCFTPLHAAARAGSCRAIEVCIAEEMWPCRNCFGHTTIILGLLVSSRNVLTFLHMLKSHLHNRDDGMITFYFHTTFPSTFVYKPRRSLPMVHILMP
jgi:hypothetical protein